ncbi:3-phosphoshikimate 1-carboxyvinyltransferase [Salmonella enterica]|nr:3-phosphoshikimate 1-carboxyvinyltransferase [Salmonella enterica]
MLLAALACGKTVLTNLLDSDDVRHMLNALSALGINYTLSADRTRCDITGNGGALRAPGALELFLGNAGTAMRPLAAALCLGQNEIVLTGEPRMKERPIGHLVDALRQGGANIDTWSRKIIRPCVCAAALPAAMLRLTVAFPASSLPLC